MAYTIGLYRTLSIIGNRYRLPIVFHRYVWIFQPIFRIIFFEENIEGCVLGIYNQAKFLSTSNNQKRRTFLSKQTFLAYLKNN